jgi:hypothetical protein
MKIMVSLVSKIFMKAYFTCAEFYHYSLFILMKEKSILVVSCDACFELQTSTC